MISVQEALTILQNNLPEPKIKNIILDEAFGCILSENIVAPESSPRYTNSAMDGFALRWADYHKSEGDQPVTRLKIIGESQAGIPFEAEVEPGTAIRISTGAMLPSGADSVVRVEDTEEKDGYVKVLELKKQGQDVRRAGEEFCQGKQLFTKGDVLGARELALLAAVGAHKVPVYSQPKVSLLVTGTELAAYDEATISPHQIRDSNSIMLASAVKEVGGLPESITHIEDSLAQTTEAVQTAVDSGADVIICSGGVSVGNHDHVKEAALAVGFEELFWKIRQKPGKPLFVSRLGDALLFGLPGNPVSAYMCFVNYVRPTLAALQGTTSIHQKLTATTAERLVNTGKRTNFIRVTVEDNPNAIAIIKEATNQGSHMLSSIVHADGYIVMQPGDVIETGSLVEVVLF
ncbi:MAG: molybdopterin molybdotransferase MoeA [Desulfobulbaceae bacterium]|nr:molybdopterin molybdotransferase MoeA [Desulfobulbaceae bacterium]